MLIVKGKGSEATIESQGLVLQRASPRRAETSPTPKAPSRADDTIRNLLEG